MLDTLTKGFRNARQKLTGMGEFTEENINDALREVRLALLEADVDFKVTKMFLNTVKEELLGQEIKIKAKAATGRKVTISPGEIFIKSCYDQLVNLMGPVDTSLQLPTRGISTFMMVGLQGSGKTTTTGKLASFLMKKHGRKPMLVAADVYRPAAIEQLKVLGKRLGIPVYSEDTKDPPGICDRAMKTAKMKGRDTLIFDTAGRLAIDEVLMEELVQIKARVNPENVFLVIDSMIGQDAVKTAKAFDDKLDLTGTILTKLDGDARGGSALSIKTVTGKPIKFLGMGESLDKLEEFRPEGMASRILGMGDVVGLVQDFEDVVDSEKAEKDAKRMLQGKFDMADFLEQITMIQKMGSLKDLMEKMPFFPDGLPQDISLDDKELVRIQSMIKSMTNEERKNPDIMFDIPDMSKQPRWKTKKKVAVSFNESRIKRISRGSGTTEDDVRSLLSRFLSMRQIMAMMGQNQGLLNKLPIFKQLNQMKQLKNMDVNDMMAFSGMGGQGMDEMPQDPGMMGAGGLRKKGSSIDKSKAKKKKKIAKKSRKNNKKR
ncbi:MAG: signal recognition particle protein [Deltaproteobacteria bacterium]|nr:signal recognition particle protein [Deltaproteobacteria bacterium]